MFKYSNACADNLLRSKQAYQALLNSYGRLELEASDWRDRTNACLMSKAELQAALIKEENRKRIWRKVAIGEGTLILGAAALFYFLP